MARIKTVLIMAGVMVVFGAAILQRAQALTGINQITQYSMAVAETASEPVPDFEANGDANALQAARQFARTDGPDRIFDMNFGLGFSLVQAALVPDPDTSGLSFSAMPQIIPGSGAVGTVFTFDLGAAGPGDPALQPALMLDGVDITDQIVMQGDTPSYTSDTPGALIWQVQADNGAGDTASQTVTGTIEAASTLTVDQGAAQFDVIGASVHNLDATGRAYIVATPESTLSAISPAPATVGGRLVGGAQKNPQRLTSGIGDQGYDARTLDANNAQNYDAALTLATPVSLAAGDRIVKAIPNTGTVGYGEPLNADYVTLHVVSAPLPANAVLGPTVGWAAQSEPEYYTVDIAAVMALFENRPSTGFEFPSFSVLMSSLDVSAPIFAQNSATYRETGYEPFMPPGIAGGIVAGNGVQYGRDIAEVFDLAAISLHYDVYSAAEKEQIVWTLIRHGIEWVFPVIGSDFPILADGGHQQFWQFAGLLALVATGREDEIDTFMQDTGGGNWDQYFEITEALIASDFSPHTDPNKPQLWRERVLGAQPGGAVVQIPVSGSDQVQTYIAAGAAVMRNGRPAAYVSEETKFTNSGTLDVPLDAQPVPAFAAGDVITFSAGPGGVQAGRFEWLQRPGYGPSGIVATREMFSPSVTNQYRSLQRNIGALMALRGIGYHHPSMMALWGYQTDIATSGGTYPAPDNAYTLATSPVYGLDGQSYPAVEQIWAAEHAYFDTLPQVYSVEPAAPLSLTRIVASGTPAPGPITDGLVIGLVAGQTNRAVEIAGQGGDGAEVQIRLLRQSDDSEALGWFNAGTVSNGTFRTVIDVPKSDDWLKVEMRYAGGAAVYSDTTKWAVGYKFLMLGQSQMTIMLTTSGAGYTMAPANLGTASYYSWHDYNLAGNYSTAEELVVLDGTQTVSDGVASFIDQYRVFDPDTPIQIVRESVNGTSILDFTDDALTQRSWGDFTDKTSRYGGDITAVLENWNTANQGALEGAEDIDILQGINPHLGEHSATPQHALRDVLQRGYVFATMGATRNSRLLNDVNHSGQKITRANELGYPVGLTMGDYEIDGAGGPHPLPAGQGNVRMGARVAILAARAVGLAAPANPYFESTAERSVDGTYIDLPVVLPNGGTLTSPNPTNLSGFEVDEGAGYSSAGFTASIEGDAVRLTKDSGIWAASSLLKLRRHANLDLNSPMDSVAEQAIVAGELYETWAGDTTGTGLPVHGTLVGGQWSLEANVIETVTQASGGTSGGVVQVELLKVSENTDASADVANRERWSYGAFVETGTPVPAGTEILIGALHISAQAGGLDFNDFQARNSGGATVGAVTVEETYLNSPGGAIRSVRALSFTQTAIALDLRAFSTSRQAITALASYKLDGVSFSGAITGSGADTVTLTGVPAGSTIVAFAQGLAPITWAGVSEDTVYTSDLGGTATYQTSAVGTGEGTVAIGASGANELVVIALPPV